MATLLRLPSKAFRWIAGQPSSVATPPSVAWLLEHREERRGQLPISKGSTQTASLYRMYEYLVIGEVLGLRTEIEYFFNQPSWAVSAIPDPADSDPQRYAILSCLPYVLTTAFNRLIECGLPRGGPAVIADPAAEEEPRTRRVVLEKEPDWVKGVPKLEQRLVIPNGSDEEPAAPARNPRFLDMNIVVDGPHVLFV